jgi:peptidoglycan/xylan/chitin deacetylase (PgdA/CDA1 family)
MKTLRKGLWRARGTLFGGGVILGYHRIAEVLSDPWDMCVPAEVFAAQMEVVQRDFRPVKLSTLDRRVASRENGRGPPPVAVTFDDGYVDVALDGLPVLERFGVPATLFVVADSLGGVFWWDRLLRVLEAGPGLPPELDLRIGEARLVWNREAGDLANALFGPLRSLEPTARNEALETLQRWAGMGDVAATCPSTLSAEEVAGLAGHPLVEIGSHSATHSELPELPLDRLEQEIFGSRHRLEDIVGQPVESFSYPHGLVDVRTERAVAAAGYLQACASWNGLVRPRRNAYRQPRLWPSAASASEFRAWLRSWTGH